MRRIPESLGELADYVVVKEWDLKTPEAMARFSELNIFVFPAIAINGKVVFKSETPSENELLEAIRSRM
ncbi:MAG: hypothetical protein Q7I94_04375 [Candidatus Contubernalis sp.]|nr:hypothetical protein [Candidatus Contubernalis sp.]